MSGQLTIIPVGAGSRPIFERNEKTCKPAPAFNRCIKLYNSDATGNDRKSLSGIISRVISCG